MGCSTRWEPPGSRPLDKFADCAENPAQCLAKILTLLKMRLPQNDVRKPHVFGPGRSVVTTFQVSDLFSIVKSSMKGDVKRHFSSFDRKRRSSRGIQPLFLADGRLSFLIRHGDGEHEYGAVPVLRGCKQWIGAGGQPWFYLRLVAYSFFRLSETSE